ncbi:Fur family transcriptional regulator [Anaerosinus massiliensis]|uniref:Fur family transcriptional regulator n=1 Tax=Massilibacillus massiliensis TaxID=1806837 RepID=UPI000B335BFA|nr:Fur family transcriptional regulator [Massilibacillus massiliensis]
MNTSELRKKLDGRYKLTRQREFIYHILSSYTSHHLSAEDIYKIVHEQYPEIGLATIYRTLELFSTLAVVQKLDLGDGCQRYELYPLHHHHLICNACGKVIEARGKLADTAMDAAIDDMTDFSVLNYQLYIYMDIVGIAKSIETTRVFPSPLIRIRCHVARLSNHISLSIHFYCLE